MKINDLLFFAPSIPFEGLKIHSPDIVEKFRARIEGYYLTPARLMLDHDEAFAATVLLVSTMDAIVRYDSAYSSIKRDGERYIAWLQTEMSHLFSHKPVATQFYKDIRCGSVHEARIKNGCVFNFKPGVPIFVENGIMAVNPKRLIGHIADALDRFCKKTVGDKKRLEKFQETLSKDFEIELR